MKYKEHLDINNLIRQEEQYVEQKFINYAKQVQVFLIDIVNFYFSCRM